VRVRVLSSGVLGSVLLLGAAGQLAAGPAPRVASAGRPAGTGPAAVDLRVEAQLGGALQAVAAADDRIFVGAGPRVVALDAPGSGNPVELGASEVLPGNVTALAVDGGTVFAGYGLRDEVDPSGLVVLDGRGTGAPAVLGRLALVGEPVAVKTLGATVVVVTRRLTEDGRPYPTSTVPWPRPAATARPPVPVVYGAAAPLGAGQPEVTLYHGGEVLTVDVSDPTSPRVVGRLALAEVPVALAVDAGRAFVLAADPTQGRGMPGVLVGVDLADVSAPRRAGLLPIGGSIRLGGGLDVHGDYAYVAAGDFDPGLVVVDVRDTQRMQVVTAWQSMATEVIRIGHYLYLAELPETTVLDAADPTHLAWVGAISESWRKFARLGERLVATQNVFDADAQAIGNWVGVGVYVIPPDQAAQVRRTGLWTSLSDLSSLAADGARLYVTVGTDLLATIDAVDPRSPRQVAATPWTDGDWSLISTQMALGDGILAMTQPAASPSGLFLADLGSPVPHRSASVGLAAWAVDLAASGRLVVVAVVPPIERGPPPFPRTPVPPGAAPPLGSGQPSQTVAPALRVFDATDPAQPRQVGSLAIAGSPAGVAMQATTAYVATGSDLQVIDLTRPDAPRLVTTVAGVAGRHSLYDRSVVLIGTRLAVVTEAGIRLFDVSAPDAPRDAGALTLPDVIKVALSDTWLFAVTRDAARVDTVLAYALEPLAAAPAARFVVPGAVAAVTVQAGALVVATDDSGLYWLRPDRAEPLRGVGPPIWLPAVSTGRW
jgi:hypothetical protein